MGRYYQRKCRDARLWEVAWFIKVLIYYYYLACFGVGQDRVSYKTDVILVGEKGGADLRKKEELNRSCHLH